MIILHGEHTVASRNRLQELVDAARGQGTRIVRLSGNKLDRASLESKLGTVSLFGQDQLIVIEQLLTGRVSNRKKAAVELLSATNPDGVILWEDKSLGKRALKPFDGAQTEEFKLSKVLFSWLDSFGTKPKSTQLKLLHQALEQEDAYFIFIMLARQLRLLIQVADSGSASGPPFVVRKLKGQAGNFSLSQLLDLHAKLLEIDYRQKTSQNRLTLTAELDLLLLSV